ncbi:hypothetical protein DPMN_082860 [Dreissena polymorpha]|uniref:E3 ubiquitin-protein ligase RNF220 middle domain-containing protein n=1 Tax=Dreissena polymorpha TaxID=45954 RepID=A0A9D3YA14_DREPO|nr:hypothetical protein DPMN_082860 [Dreissena polymorpha]
MGHLVCNHGIPVFQRDEEDGVMVDVETDGEDNLGYEEYTWAGQTRIRASTMLDGGYAGIGNSQTD